MVLIFECPHFTDKHSQFDSGLQNRQRKSALWHYLYKFGRQNENTVRFKGTIGCQAYCVPLVDTKPYILPGMNSVPSSKGPLKCRLSPMFSFGT